MSAKRIFEVVDGSPKVMVVRVQGSIDIDDLEKDLIDQLMDIRSHDIRHVLIDWTQLDGFAPDARRAIGTYVPLFDGRYDKVAVLTPTRFASVVSDIKSHASTTEIQSFDDGRAALAWLQGGEI